MVHSRDFLSPLLKREFNDEALGMEASVEYNLDDSDVNSNVSDDEDDDDDDEDFQYDFDFDFDGNGYEDDERNVNDSLESRSEIGKISECTRGYNAETLEPFTYAPQSVHTEGHAIRLLRLEKGTGQIRAYLFNAFLHKTGNGMPYEALSYTWGNDQRTEPIILNGKRFMVTQNLYSALRYLRLKNEDRILWIDAICIDQSYIPERNHQVRHMSFIYRDAERVLFWLGLPTYETDLLLSSLKRLQHYARDFESASITQDNAYDLRWKELWKKFGFCDNLNPLREGLILLLERPWFRRSWILQEVSFAESGVVVCGTKQIPAHIFTLAPWLLGHKPKAHCEAVLHMMPGVTRSTRKFLSGRDMRNLYSLLSRFYRSEAGDPRDQVYALLNMATDAKMSGFPVADYRKPFSKVLDSVFAYLFPKSWALCGETQTYPTLSSFVEDFPSLLKSETQTAKPDLFLEARFTDDTDLFYLHLQEVLGEVIRTNRTQLLHDLLKFPNIDLNAGIVDTTNLLSPPLCVAASSGFTSIASALLATSKIDINARDSDHRTPLLSACRNGHEDIVSLLLAHPAIDVCHRDEFHMTPLAWACQRGYTSIVHLLLSYTTTTTTHEIDINAPDASHFTPLLHASRHGHSAAVKLLLATGKADINANDQDGRAALSHASEHGHEDVVRLLLEAKGVHVNARDMFQHTALSWAFFKGRKGVAVLLVEGGAEGGG